jgi:hypothetical protein
MWHRHHLHLMQLAGERAALPAKEQATVSGVQVPAGANHAAGQVKTKAGLTVKTVPVPESAIHARVPKLVYGARDPVKWPVIKADKFPFFFTILI